MSKMDGRRSEDAGAADGAASPAAPSDRRCSSTSSACSGAEMAMAGGGATTPGSGPIEGFFESIGKPLLAL